MPYTPGPWKIVPRLHAEMHAAVIGAEGRLVVNLGDGGNGLAEQCANAHLIVTAPELLDALKYARRFLNKNDHDIAFVDNVINRAEGGR